MVWFYAKHALLFWNSKYTSCQKNYRLLFKCLWMARFSAKGRKTFQHCSSQSASLAAVDCPLWNSNWWFQGITMMETNQPNKQICKLFWESKNKILDTPPSKSSGLQWHLEFLYFSAPSICKPIVFTLLPDIISSGPLWQCSLPAYVQYKKSVDKIEWI